MITCENIVKLSGVAARVSQLKPELAPRIIRALGIVADQGVSPFQKCSDVYTVRSQSGEEPYQVATDPEDGHLICTCADHTMRENLLCKHVLAVRLIQALPDLDGARLPLLIVDVKTLRTEALVEAKPYYVPF